MAKQDALKPVDVVVALALALERSAQPLTYSALGHLLGVSSSTTHQAVSRLQGSGLLRPGTREPNVQALRNFLVHGVRHAFPAALGREARGVPTAHSGPVLNETFDSGSPVVWPDVRGSVRGTALIPLYPQATKLPVNDPKLYGVLTLVDALRMGQVRERNAAMAALDKALGMSSSSPHSG